jgi:hypothetical protein
LKANGAPVVTPPNGIGLPDSSHRFLARSSSTPITWGFTRSTLNVESEPATASRNAAARDTASVKSGLEGLVKRMIRAIQMRLLRRKPHRSDGIYAVYSRGV